MFTIAKYSALSARATIRHAYIDIDLAILDWNYRNATSEFALESTLDVSYFAIVLHVACIKKKIQDPFLNQIIPQSFSRKNFSTL